MIISQIGAGLGNQMFKYAAGRRLAHKLNTEFKLNIFSSIANKMYPYGLDRFNITATIATPEEINKIKNLSGELGIEPRDQKFMPEVLDYPDNVYLRGYFIKEQYFMDIADIIREEFTLKNPSPAAKEWMKKILSAECAVSMHFRHGDFVYNPTRGKMPWHKAQPLYVYQGCLNALKQQYKNLTVFAFSDNMEWIKANLRLDVPTEFVEGCVHAAEDLYLMSLCKHNILSCASTFSRWGAWLNQNPDKKVFVPFHSTAKRVRDYTWSLKPFKDSPIDFERWIRVPFDPDDSPNVIMRPFFSLLLVVNNDVDTIADTLNNLLGQDYNYYDVIIIDNASTDGSDKICQQAVEGKKNVTYKRLEAKVNNATAWNMALKRCRGYYISFLKSGDHYIPETLSKLYITNEYRLANIIHLFAWLEENETGDVTFADKKYSVQRDLYFQKATKSVVLSTNGQDAVKFLLDKRINGFLGTKFYNVEFLMEHGIKFDETLDDTAAEISFQKEAFLKSKYFMYLANALYITPKN